MAVESPSATEYIQHHMAHLQSMHQNVIVDFSVINYDTIFFSLAALLVVFFLLRMGAKKATSGVPGKMQCAVEMLVEWWITRPKISFMVTALILRRSL